jgi:hypothetical protein
MKIVVKTKQDRAKAIEAVKDIRGDPVMIVEIKEFKETRSQAQNRLMWKWYGQLSEHIFEHHGKRYSPKVIHETCKELWQPTIPYEDMNGKHCVEVKSTTDNNTKEQHLFLEKLCHYAADPWGCVVTVPDDLLRAYPEK